MASEWPTMTLRDAHVTLIDCDHRTPPAAETGYPYVAIPQLRGGRIDLSDVRRIARERFLEWTRKARPTANDVILSRRCNPGETAVAPPDLEFALGQNLVLLRADGKTVYPPFLRWLVRGPEWWEQISKFINVGAVFDSLKCADVPNFELHIPPIPEQHAIAHILGTLDDKIELNRRMNETLEAMARAIVKSWFVDFDPVRAKAEGREPGLPKHIADLFPDRFEDSELGEIPAGWEVSGLRELMELEYGKALKEENRKLGIIPVYGSNGQVGWHDEALAKGPGIIVGRKGNPGVTTWSPTDFFAIDTTFYVVPKSKCPSFPFLFFALLGQDLGSLAADSAVPGLNRNFVYSNQQITPPPNVVRSFDQFVEVLFDRRHQNDIEARTLTALRDALLPKLLSGEISYETRRN